MVRLPLRGIFNKVFEWRFDVKRVNSAKNLRDKWKPDKIKKLLEEDLLDFELGLEYNEERVSLFYTCHAEHIPTQVWEFWDMLQTNVMLVPTGMGGVTFRDSKESTIKLVERYGYDPQVVNPYVEEYERKLLDEYDNSRGGDTDGIH